MIFVANLIHYVFGGFAFGLLIYILCSWIDHPNAYAVRRWLAQFYEPFLSPIRRAIPAPMVGHTAIDLSPILLYFAVMLVKRALLALLLPPF